MIRLGAAYERFTCRITLASNCVGNPNAPGKALRDAQCPLQAGLVPLGAQERNAVVSMQWPHGNGHLPSHRQQSTGWMSSQIHHHPAHGGLRSIGTVVGTDSSSLRQRQDGTRYDGCLFDLFDDAVVACIILERGQHLASEWPLRR